MRFKVELPLLVAVRDAVAEPVAEAEQRGRGRRGRAAAGQRRGRRRGAGGGGGARLLAAEAHFPRQLCSGVTCNLKCWRS